MSYYLTRAISGNTTALRKKQGQTRFTYLRDEKGRLVKFLGWEQDEVWS